MDMLEGDGPDQAAADLFVAGHVCASCDQPTEPDRLEGSPPVCLDCWDRWVRSP